MTLIPQNLRLRTSLPILLLVAAGLVVARGSCTAGVRAGGGPVIDDIVPNVGGQGATLNVTLFGTGLGNNPTVSFGGMTTVNTVTSNAEGTQVVVNLTIDPNDSQGLRIVSVTDANMNVGEFCCFAIAPGESSGKIVVTPKKVNFGATRPGSQKKKIVKIRNVSPDEPLEVFVDGPFTPFSGPGSSGFQLGPGEKKSIRLGFSPDQKGRFESEFIVISSDKDAARTDIPVTGKGR